VHVPQRVPRPKPPARGWRAQARSLGVALGIVVLLRSFVAEAFFIPSESMQPTLEVGDRVLVSKFSYGLRVPWVGWRLLEGPAPQRGDVVVFVHPKTGEDLIKRVVAVAGDSVELREGTLYVNGQAAPRHALGGECRMKVDEQESMACKAFQEELGGKHYTVWQRADWSGDVPLTRVPPGSAFVLGDNRDNSNDSRFWGPVPYRNLKGRAQRILWSYTWSGGVRGERWFKALP
jgi:signal peptidase I